LLSGMGFFNINMSGIGLGQLIAEHSHDLVNVVDLSIERLLFT
jgi:hypothetical protein